MKRVRITVGMLAFVALFAGVATCEDQPRTVTVCELKSDPAAYNHKLVEVTGFVSHAFEDFTIFDPTCPSWPGVWLEYGGKAKSGTMYCCGVTADRHRPKELKVAFYAHDPTRIAWVVAAGYVSSCGKNNAVTRLK